MSPDLVAKRLLRVRDDIDIDSVRRYAEVGWMASDQLGGMEAEALGELLHLISDKLKAASSELEATQSLCR